MSKEKVPFDVRSQNVLVQKEGRITIPQKIREYHGIIPKNTVVRLESIKKGKILLEVIV